MFLTANEALDTFCPSASFEGKATSFNKSS